MNAHVLVVARWYPSYDDPGRGSFVADQVAALRDAGATVTVASFDPTGVRGSEATRPARGAAAADLLADALSGSAALSRPRSWGAGGVPVARLPVILDGSRRRPADVVEAHGRALLPFGLALDDRQPIDIVHAHTGLPDGLAAARLADRLEIPLLTTEHASTAPDELADPDARDAYRTLLGRRRRVVAVSRSLAREVAERLGFEAREIDVLPNAVPVHAFPPGPPDGREPAELLYVGSRKATKGIETLLRAFAEVRLERPDARLRLIGGRGTTDDETRWRSLADELGVAAAVLFEDRAERAAVAAAMRHAAAFVHASPRETFGMVAAEALASGLPVAATPSGGVDEIVGRDGRFGEIATANDPSSLAETVLRVLGRRSSFEPAAMHAHVEESYGAPAIAARTLAIYRRMIDATRGALPERPGVRATPDRAPGAAPFRAPLVVGLVHELAVSRLASIPPALAAQLTVVTFEPSAGTTAGEAASGDRPTPPAGSWRSFDPEQRYRDRLAALGGPVRGGGGPGEPARRGGGLGRLVRGGGGLGRLFSAARAPRAELERRDLIARRDELRRQTIDAFLVASWESAGRPPHVLALDADDVAIVAPLVGAGAGLAPGGLRWLVDRWDESGRPQA